MNTADHSAKLRLVVITTLVCSYSLDKGQAFVEAGQDEYEERYRQRVVQNLTRRAHQLGFQLTPQGTAAA